MQCPNCGHHILSEKALATLAYMKWRAPKRGGYMFESARPAYEAGTYRDDEIAQLLACGAIEPHPDPAKGWVVKHQ